jgi:AraC-like DNA-binding protein
MYPEVALANYARFDSLRKIRLGPVESRMFLWSKSGFGRVTINRQVFDFQPFDYFVIPWNHMIEYEPDPAAPFHLAGIHMIPWHDPSVPLTWGVSHEAGNPLHRVSFRQDRNIAGLEELHHFRLSQEHPLIHLSEYIVQHAIGPMRDREHLKRCALILIAEAVFTSRTSQGLPSQIRQMQRFIEQNISRPLTVRDLAVAIDRSPSQVNRLCRVHLKQSAGDWISEVKIRAASDQLRSTRRSIFDIAAAVGYADRFYFSRLFRRKLGLSPLKYRQQQPLL